MAPSKDSAVVIVGAGAWGLSTALHMVGAGYSNITVLDRTERIPSPYSAACDLNKIVRAEYEDRFYTDLALVCFHILRQTMYIIHAIIRCNDVLTFLPRRTPSKAGKLRSSDPLYLDNYPKVAHQPLDAVQQLDS